MIKNLLKVLVACPFFLFPNHFQRGVIDFYKHIEQDIKYFSFEKSFFLKILFIYF